MNRYDLTDEVRRVAMCHALNHTYRVALSDKACRNLAYDKAGIVYRSDADDREAVRRALIERNFSFNVQRALHIEAPRKERTSSRASAFLGTVLELAAIAVFMFGIMALCWAMEPTSAHAATKKVADDPWIIKAVWFFGYWLLLDLMIVVPWSVLRFFEKRRDAR